MTRQMLHVFTSSAFVSPSRSTLSHSLSVSLATHQFYNEMPSLMRVPLWRSFNTFQRTVYRLQFPLFTFVVFLFLFCFLLLLFSYTFFFVLFVERKRWLSSFYRSVAIQHRNRPMCANIYTYLHTHMHTNIYIWVPE